MIFAKEHARIDDAVETLWRVEYRAWDHSKGSKPIKATHATWHTNQEAAEMDAKFLSKRSDVFYVAISKWRRDAQPSSCSTRDGSAESCFGQAS